MSFSLIASANTTFSGTGTFTLNVSGGPYNPGDIVVVQLGSFQTLVPTYSLADNISTQNVYNGLNFQTSGQSQQAIYMAVLAVGKPSTFTLTLTVSGTVTADGVFSVAVFRGVKSTAYDALTFSAATVGTVSNVAFPAATVPSTLQDLVIGFVLGFQSGGSFNVSSTDSTLAASTTGAAIVYKLQTANSSDECHVNVTNNGTNTLLMASLTLRAAAASSTVMTVAGGQRPWEFYGNGVNNAGPVNTNVGANAGYNDGTNANSLGSTTLNTTKRYGQLHTTAGEVATQVISGLVAGDTITVIYMGGQGVQISGGGGFSNPTGNGGGIGYTTDGSGYVFPSDYLAVSTFSAAGLMGAFLASDNSVVSTWRWSNATGNAGDSVTYTVPAGAVAMSFGVNDSNLHDNAGSWVLNIQQGSGSNGTFPMGGGITSGISKYPHTTQDSTGGLPVKAGSLLDGGVWANTTQGQRVTYPSGGQGNIPGPPSPPASTEAPTGDVYPTSGQVWPSGRF